MFAPYPYQKTALKKVTAAFRLQMAVLVVMATGLGKTVLAALWAAKEVKRGRGLFLCHAVNILNQAMQKFGDAFGQEVTLGRFNASEKTWHEVDILFATFQSMKGWKEHFKKDEFTFIMVDESHHSHASSFRKVIDYFTPQKLFAMTATPDRMDAKDIREIFGKEVVNIGLEEAIGKGWLTPVEYRIITDNLDEAALEVLTKEVLEGGKRISLKHLNERVFIKSRDEKVAQIILGYRKKTIVFCESIRHARNFSKFLPGSKVYHSGIADEVNEKTLEGFRNGTVQYILVVNMFNESVDIPDTEVVAFLRSTQSKTIFLQQLGRGLRKSSGKDKVVVLDFVANCDRIALVKKLSDDVREFAAETEEREPRDRRVVEVSGESFNFLFTAQAVDLLKIMERINRDFYPTWEEAGKAARRLGIGNSKKYSARYKEDPRLPSNPYNTYPDFPNWLEFLGTDFYPTWEEAGEAARKSGVGTAAVYRIRYKENPRLPSHPDETYQDFPGWTKFLGKEVKDFYPTWQEAGEAASQLGIESQDSYQARYKENPKLPSAPDQIYHNFPSWTKFLGKDNRWYPTWQEAGEAATRLGIAGRRSHREQYKRDSRLPSNPQTFYKNFPGWLKFLGKK